MPVIKENWLEKNGIDNTIETLQQDYLDLLKNHHEMVKHYTYIIDRLNEKIKEMEEWK